jgi:hypothetical protein
VDESKKYTQTNSQNQRYNPKILRAHDIFPPTNEKSTQSPNDISEPTNIVEINHIKKLQNTEPLHPNASHRQKTEKKEHIQSKIPKFDLANEIMAEHRKRIAKKRMGPADQITPPQSNTKEDSASKVTEMTLPENAETDKIITQIVARDIEWLYNHS